MHPPVSRDLAPFRQLDHVNRRLVAPCSQTLAKPLASHSDAIVYDEHLEHDGALVFDHACRMGLEGIVSKRLGAPYRSGPSKVWLKSKNPLSEAVRREAEEDWG